ncbi:MAG: PIN domain-containing protein [Saprospiraceae bacterium]
MDFVLDTNILVHFVRSDAHIRQLDDRFHLFAPENSTFVSLVSVGEIRSLAFQLNWGEAKIQRMNFFLHALNPFPVESDEIAAAYADLDAYSQCLHPRYPTPTGMSSRNMGKNDLWIAATAILFNATLLTTDADFEHLAPLFLKVERVRFLPA